MITELRLFGTTGAKMFDFSKHIMDTSAVGRGSYACEKRTYSYIRGIDRVLWLETDKDGCWKQCISGMEFASLTIHLSLGAGVKTEEDSKRVMDDIHYALTRVRGAQESSLL